MTHNSKNWDQYLGLLLAAYRATPHPGTGYSPNMLMFGREVNMPKDLLYPFPRPEEPCKFINMTPHSETGWKNVTMLPGKIYELRRQKRDCDNRIVEYTYKVGNMVYKRVVMCKKNLMRDTLYLL